MKLDKQQQKALRKVLDYLHEEEEDYNSSLANLNNDWNGDLNNAIIDDDTHIYHSVKKLERLFNK